MTIKPQAGDIVEWQQQQGGDYISLVIEGLCGVDLEEPLCTHSYSVFHNGAYVDCSGGPAVHLRTDRMVNTGKTRKIVVWQWQDLPRKDGGVEREIIVRVWRYE